MNKTLIAIAIAGCGLVSVGALAETEQTNPQDQRGNVPEQSNAVPAPRSSDEGSTQLSADSDAVQAVQLALADQGYNPGTIDGRLHGQTEDALRQVQRDNGLSQTGQINAETLNALGFVLIPESEAQTPIDPGGSPEPGNTAPGVPGSSEQSRS
jgi:peptidoglycan hydrolase-like protein with peptidoglycan-binding domain